MFWRLAASMTFWNTPMKVDVSKNVSKKQVGHQTHFVSSQFGAPPLITLPFSTCMALSTPSCSLLFRIHVQHVSAIFRGRAKQESLFLVRHFSLYTLVHEQVLLP